MVLKFQNRIFKDLQAEIKKIKAKISFVIIQVGDNEESNLYIKKKIEAAKKLKINAILVKLPEFVSEQELLAKIVKFNNDQTIHGIIIQLPLTPNINENKIFQQFLHLKILMALHDE